MIISARPFPKLSYLYKPSEGANQSKNLFYFSKGRFALLYGLNYLDVKIGQSILVPSFMCYETIEPLEKFGYNLVYADIDQDLNFRINDIISIINKNDIKAILVVNYFGFQSNIKELINVCSNLDVKFIEDCAHSFMTSIKNSKYGSFGDITIYSYRKSLPIYDGGLLKINKHTRQYKNYNIKSQNKIKSISYFLSRMLELIITYIGYPNIYSDSITNFKDFLRSKINFKVGSSIQLDMVIPSDEFTNYISDLNYMSNTKTNVVKNYNFIINNAIGLGYKPLFKHLPKGTIPQFAIIYDVKGGLVKWLRSKGVGANRWPWKNLPSNVRNSTSLFPNANMFNESLVLLPIHQDISKNHCVKIISLLEVWNKRD